MRVACHSAPAGIACEFGVFTGSSLRTIRNYRKPPVFGFDSFEGLPLAWKFGEKTHNAGHFACSLPGDLQSGVHLVQGWFEDTLPRWLAENPGDIAFCHIDCDLYESASYVLNAINERIKPRAVIAFDELVEFGDGGYSNWRDGEWKALIEWMDLHDREVKPIGRTHCQRAVLIVTK